jgi:ABC-2 type transport system ATP-binding protein
MINIHQLDFGYGKQKQVFSKLNLSLRAGRVYGLLGPNGAGKSSLLKLMGGLLFPVSGNCEVNGFRAGERLPSFLQELFFLPEEFYMPSVRIKSYIDVNAPFYPNFNKEQFNDYLKEFQLSDNQKIGELSLGQKKKVIIGFGLATNTKVLLMDEPTNGLDIPSKSQFRKIIASAVNEERIIVISTHQVRDLESLIDDVIILNESQLIINTPMETVAEKLSFKVVPTIENPEEVLYSEHSLKGFSVVSTSTKAEHSKVDLELLFNAAIGNKIAFQQLFNESDHE